MQASMHLRASSKLQAARPAPGAGLVPRTGPVASRRSARVQPVAAVVADFDAKVILSASNYATGELA
jgi:hypothetical protein